MRNLHEGYTGPFEEPVIQVLQAWNLTLKVPQNWWKLPDRFYVRRTIDHRYHVPKGNQCKSSWKIEGCIGEFLIYLKVL